MPLTKVRNQGLSFTSGIRNLIINGAMQVAQRGDTTGVTVGYGGPDRYKFARDGAAEVTLSQDTTVPSSQGFKSSLKIDVTTADSSLAAGDYALISTRLEGQDLQHLMYGTSGAKSLTLQFWVRSPKTGTHIVELYHGDVFYTNSQTYTIASADTWQKVTLTFDGYQTSVLDNDNGIGIQVAWWLAAGSTYSGGTLSSNTWHNTAANRAVGQVNVMDSTSNNFYITGVQLEIGDSASDFEHRSFEDELRRCQRYYIRKKADSAYTFFGAGFNATTSSSRIHVNFPVEMRSAPSIGQSANSTFAIYSGVNSPGFSADATVNNPSTHGTALTTTHPSSTLTVGYGALLMANNDTSAFLEFIAEL